MHYRYLEIKLSMFIDITETQGVQIKTSHC